jgi:four helix bundle protein
VAAARTFQELAAWQRCAELRDLILSLTEVGKCLRDPRFRDQIRRAAQSAPNLIAEGFLRFTPAEFVRYLRMARGEIGEIQNELLYERPRKYFTDEQSHQAAILCRRAMGTTTNLLKSKLPLLKKARRRLRSPN